MMHLTEYRKRPALLADWLPWAGLVAPGVVLNKDGAFQRSARFRGPDLDSATQGGALAVFSEVHHGVVSTDSNVQQDAVLDVPRKDLHELRIDPRTPDRQRVTHYEKGDARQPELQA